MSCERVLDPFNCVRLLSIVLGSLVPRLHAERVYVRELKRGGERKPGFEAKFWVREGV